MSKLEWILGLILVALLLIAAGLAVSLWIRPQITQSTDENNPLAAYADDVAKAPPTSGQTAKNAFVVAQKRAQAWQPDAALVSASATWPQGAQPSYIEQGATDWGFMFHSPAAASYAVVTVSNGEALFIQGESKDPIDLLQSSSWQLDSSDVVSKFLTEGGEAFINTEGITILSMTFATNNPNENGRLEWQISAFATQSGHAYIMRVDAASGEILEVINASS
jgi:hypothetical protein